MALEIAAMVENLSKAIQILDRLIQKAETLNPQDYVTSTPSRSKTSQVQCVFDVISSFLWLQLTHVTPADAILYCSEGQSSQSDLLEGSIVFAAVEGFCTR